MFLDFVQNYNISILTLVDFGLFDFWTFFEDFFNTKKSKNVYFLDFLDFLIYEI